MGINTIDWEELWRQEKTDSYNDYWEKLSQDNAANKALWEEQAEGFNKIIFKASDHGEGREDDYTSKMLARIEVNPEWSVLDIGCGPGTLSIPLAKKAKSVTGLDISTQMLKYLQQNAAENSLNNIACINSPWKDAIADKKVGMHDVVVASRSLEPLNIREMLTDIDSIARRAVYLTFSVVHLSLDFDVYRAVGRDISTQPAHIFIFNILNQMGIQANVEIIHSRLKTKITNIEKTIDDIQWRTAPFTPEEKAKAAKYLSSNLTGEDNSGYTHEGYSKWALVWWRKEDTDKGKEK